VRFKKAELNYRSRLERQDN